MIISITNQKGGVGKTTTAINLAVNFAAAGKRTCLIDLDPQANLTSGIGYKSDKPELDTIYNVLLNSKQAEESLFQTRFPNLFLIPSTIELAGAEIELVNTISRENVLRESLSDISGLFDFIVIDCPPSLGLLTINALTASDKVLIPVQTEYFALEGLGQLLKTIKLVKSKLNSRLSIAGVIMTMYDKRTNLSKDVVSEVEKVFGNKVYSNMIPRNVRLSESPSHGMPIEEYDASSTGAEAYRLLSEEILKGLYTRS